MINAGLARADEEDHCQVALEAGVGLARDDTAAAVSGAEAGAEEGRKPRWKPTVEAQP